MPAPDPTATHFEAAALRQRSVHGSAAIFIAHGCRISLRFASQIFIARLLVPADYGLIAMLTPFMSLLQLVGDLGLGQTVIVRRDISGREISTLFWLGLGINATLALLLALTSPLIARIYHEPRLVMISLVLAALLPVSSLTTQHVALLNRNMRFGALAILDIAPGALGLAAGISGAWSGWGYWSLVAVAVAETVGTVVIAFSFSPWWPSPPSNPARAWSSIKFGTHITVYNFANYATTSVSNLLLGITRGEVALGLYDRGYKLVGQPIAHLIMPINRVAIPLLTRLGPDEVRYQQAYLDMVNIMLLIGMPGILFAMVLAKPIVILLLGQRWAAVAPIFAWFCLGSLMSPIYSSTFWLFVTQGRASQQTYYVTVTSVIAVLSFVAGLPWGPVGVAAGGALSFVFLITPLVCWGATRAGVITLATLARAWLPFLIAALATVGVLQLAKSYLATNHVVFQLGLCLLIAYGTFLAVLLCLPDGNPVIRRAWHLGMLLTRGRQALATEI